MISNLEGEVKMNTLKELSFSSVKLLRSCPRKFFLLKSQIGERESTIDTAFGSAVGAGVQEWLVSKDLNKAFYAAFRHWDHELLDENPKSKKSIGDALLAIESFTLTNPLVDFDIIYWNGAPATELGFYVDLGEGFVYRGFADLVLRNRKNNEIYVLDIKTTGANYFNMNTYRNSEQVLGYSIILDEVAKTYVTNFTCLYLTYKSGTREWCEPAMFPKTLDQRIDWIRTVLSEKSRIQSYISNDFFPMHGESCVAYSRDCQFMGVCEMYSYISMIPSCGIERDEDMSKYQIQTNLVSLLKRIEQDQLTSKD